MLIELLFRLLIGARSVFKAIFLSVFYLVGDFIVGGLSSVFLMKGLIKLFLEKSKLLPKFILPDEFKLRESLAYAVIL